MSGLRALEWAWHRAETSCATQEFLESSCLNQTI